MQLIKVAHILLLALAVTAEKKIELQDIEEDNLKSEKAVEKPKRTETSGMESEQESLPFEFLKSAGLLRYYESPAQQQRYVQQYAVTEPPERGPTLALPSQYSPATQQSMMGYLSNIPMQIFIVPQYYNEQEEQQTNTQTRVQYTAPAYTRVQAYAAPENVQQQTNYIEIPAYVTPSGKTYLQHPPSSIGYLQYVASSTATPKTVSVTPMVTYQIPVSSQYPTALAAPPLLHKGYYQNSHYTDSNRLEDGQENEIESPKQFATQTETPYPALSSPEFPRYYTSRAPIREEHNHGPVPVLPPPNPLLLNSLPRHLSHTPKTLPVYRPLTKPVYATSGGLISNAISPRPIDAYGLPYKKRPTSLLDSYIPSSIQLEYMKRGFARDPLTAFDVLSGSRHVHPAPRHYERGFLPNQIYHTAAGGVTYGHYKRTPKADVHPK